MPPALVILAAGLGRRFGGDKQLVAAGPSGRPLLAYAVHDAARAGFGRAVVVTRADLVPALARTLADAALPVVFVEQTQDRPRPWGTGHAVLAAAGHVEEPFTVVNGDDFYGAGTYRVLAEFLATPQAASPPTIALATFPLGDTLSPHGPVNRGLCRSEDGWLVAIEETTGLVAGAGPPPTTPVSLNAWGFTPALFPLLAARFEAFRASAPGEDAEFMLPTEVAALVASGLARVRLLAAPGPWIGVTWPADLTPARGHLARLTQAGEYPADW